MINHRTRLSPVLAGALWVGAALPVGAQVPSPAAGASAPVSVLVNGRPVNFAGSPPQSVGGRLLVPLRAIFEALGASVDFSGGIVRAQRGPTQLQLQIGSNQATVNGTNRALDVPAQAIFGRTFVPLRFVGEALGAQVGFNPATQTVTIVSEDGVQTPGTPSNTNTTTPLYQAPDNGQSVTGTLVRLDANTVALSVNGSIRTLVVNDGALVLRQNSVASSATATPIRQPSRPSAFSSLALGETVRVLLDGNGRVSQLTALATVVLARVQFGAGNQIILDDANDTTLTLGPNLSYTDATGRASNTATLSAGQTVALFLSPANRTIYRVSSDPRDTTPQTTTGVADPLPTGSLPPAGAPILGAVQTDAATPLKAGAQLNISARATPGQRLTWSLGLRIQNQPMLEDAAQPGLYRASYTVRPGDDVLNARTTARLQGGNGFETTTQGETPITIDTVAPRLIGTFPANGASINVAQPNIAIFADDLGGSGLASATVAVVSNGVSTNIPATVAPPTSASSFPPLLF